MPTVEQDVPFLTREEVEKRAADILREHGLESIPINPVVLANRLGMAVYNATFYDDNIVGTIAKQGDQVTLLINQFAPPFVSASPSLTNLAITSCTLLATARS
ncbi:MAG TPA: hypothetical protein VN688_30705 [Gemmataceae bacterium]|nr:hypothetical protein [Gemmataceae bacterium]